MKRASLVLTLACLVAVDLLVGTERVASLVAPEPPRGALPLEHARATSELARPTAAQPAPPRSKRKDASEHYCIAKLDARYQEPLAPRTIAGWVFEAQWDDWTPVAGATVQLWPGRKYGSRAALAEHTPLGVVETQDDGAFAFAALDPGDYTLCVDRDECSSRTMFCQVSPSAQTGKLPGKKIVFGTSRVFGTVFGADGLPKSGVGFVLWPRHSDGWCPDAGGSTGADGSFDVAGLPEDRYELTLGSGLEDRLAWPQQRLSFAVGAGEVRRLDIGSARPLVHWTGVLRRSDRAPIRVTDLRMYLERPLYSGAGTDRQSIEVRVDALGAFDTWLPPGTWTPSLVNGTARDVAAHTLSAELTEEDIVVPGIRVRGTATEQGTHDVLGRLGYRGFVWISRSNESSSSLLHTASVDEAGRYALDLVEPGEWDLRFGPDWLARLEAPVRITIAPEDTERQVDLELRQP